MSLKEFLLISGVDQIMDDQQFMETEYNLVQEYHKKYGITKEDIGYMEQRGIEFNNDEWWED